jgi:hypothetical protein
VLPDIPRGRQASRAWRALSPQARAAAFDAASRGAAPSDVAVAWAAGGYGRMVARRLRVAWVLTPVVLLVLLIPVAVALVVAGASAHVVDVVMVLLLLGFLGGLIGLSVWARRYQRLYSSGLLGVEAARLGSLGPSSGQPVWRTETVESQFTVPYYAQVPVTGPLARPVPDPVAAGNHEIPVRRGPVIAYLCTLLAMALALWLVAIGLWSGVRREPLLAILFTVLTLVLTLLLVTLLYMVGPALRRPLAARFTPDGWEIPSLRMSGSWAQVRAIRVRPLSARGSTAATPQLAAYRVVVLIVDDPDRYVSHLSALRRALIARSRRRYGSPVAIVATPRRSMPVVDLVRLLQRYTPAPVEWD